MPSTEPEAVLHVAVGIVCNARQQVLIARRPVHKHQGGLWEFPGGKLEAGERLLDALRRELREELGIEVLQASQLLQVRHAYSDRDVLLDVCRVESFSGEAEGREGQQTAWVAVSELQAADFPAANAAIVHYLQRSETFSPSAPRTHQA